MTVLITMAGSGSRFKENGYLPPKFRIMARGRPLMEWSLLSLQRFFEQPFIFACLDSENADWIRSSAAALGIAEIIVAARSGVSRGQAETAFEALTHAAVDDPLWIYNIDTFIASHAVSPRDLGDATGCVPVFPCSQPNMSFVRHDSGIGVVEIAEKQPISSWASVGLYGFRSAACFAEHYREAYCRGRVQAVRGEQYVAPIYGLMLAKGERVVAPRLEANDVNILGTPAELLAFDPAARPPFGNTLPE